MAGYTSRFFLGLTISSVFGFLSVWFLKRKNPRSVSSKAIQVEEDSADDELFENQFLTTTLVSPMKLKSQEDNSCCQEDCGSSNEMQLKETQQQANSNANNNNNGVPLTNGKSKIISKSKMREKNGTLPKDYITNGDRDTAEEEDNGIELSNGIEAIDLNTMHVSSARDELLLMNAINKTYTDMEIVNGTNSSRVHKVNGDAETIAVDSPSVQQKNGGSAKEKCDTRGRNSEEVRNGQTDIPPSVQIDSCGPLTLPVVCAETNGEMLESPGATYCDSVVVDAFVHETVSYRDIVVAQKATSETQSSDDTESVVSEIGSDESVNESVQENGDASVQKVEVIAIVPSSQEDIPTARSDSAEKLNAECVNVSNQNNAKSPPEQKVTYARVCASSLKKSAPRIVAANNRLRGAECVNIQSGQSQTKGTNYHQSENQSVPKHLQNNRIQDECTTVTTSGQSQADKDFSRQQNSVPNTVQNRSSEESSLNVPELSAQPAPCAVLGSFDSGKGGSEIHYDGVKEKSEELMTYEFEILQELVGLLIGKNGRYVRYINEEAKTQIIIKRHPVSDLKKICAVTGTDEAIHAALKIIRKRFPIEQYPTVTLSQLCLVPDVDFLKLNLPEGVQFEVTLCATVNAGHFFLQQPTHPSFHSLPSLLQHMTNMYNEDVTAPPLPHLDRGYICAAKFAESWYRAEIDEVFDDTDECRVKFLDFGGYLILPRTDLKQIRFDFMSMPFQASECYLGDITYPDGATDWSDEATTAFQQISHGQILQGYICGYHENRIPYVRLFKKIGGNTIDINAELVHMGFAKSLFPPPLNPQDV